MKRTLLEEARFNLFVRFPLHFADDFFQLQQNKTVSYFLLKAAGQPEKSYRAFDSAGVYV